MSYSHSFGTHQTDMDTGLGRVRGQAADTLGQDPDPALKAATDDQLEAIETAVRVLASAVGPDDGEVTVSVSGHANPDHAERDGWANESVSITVSHYIPPTA